jgi:hypothetical protein
MRLYDALSRNSKLSSYIKSVEFYVADYDQVDRGELSGFRTTLAQAAENIIRQAKEVKALSFREDREWPLDSLFQRLKTLRPGIKRFDLLLVGSSETWRLLAESTVVQSISVRLLPTTITFTSLSASITSLEVPRPPPFSCPQLRRLTLNIGNLKDLRLGFFPSLHYLGLHGFNSGWTSDRPWNFWDNFEKLENLTVLSIDSSLPISVAEWFKPSPPLRRVSVADDRAFDPHFIYKLLKDRSRDYEHVPELEVPSDLKTGFRWGVAGKPDSIEFEIVRLICAKSETVLLLRTGQF